MSTKSSTQSQINEAKAEEMSIYNDDEENPFKLPSDELIFCFRENEKERKIIDREKNKQLRVWEKNRPVREGCLRKICETDIEPTQLAINPKVSNKVNMAEASGFTIPIERPKNRENRWKLIDKKREMFLVQQMLETKQEEIERLAEHATMREDGLTCSENMLETDTKAFLKFFNEIKEETQKASNKLDETRRNKNEKTGELRGIQDKIQHLVSNISKNIESLEVYNNFKNFLDSLPSGTKEEKEEFERMQEQKKAKQDLRLRQQEEEFNQHKNYGSNNRNKSKNNHSNQQEARMKAVAALEAELNIPTDLKNIIDDSDEEYPLRFKDENELIEIFSALEENNLLEIQRMQESEQELELKKYQMKTTEAEFAKQIAILQYNETNNQMRIEKTTMERDGLLSFTGDSSGQGLDEFTRGEIERMTQELYVVAKDIDVKTNDAAEYNKLISQSNLTMLNEIECILNGFLINFVNYEKEHPAIMQSEQREIRKINLSKKREEQKRIEQDMLEEKNAERANERDRRNFKRVGKMAMRKMYAPPVKKVEVKKKAYTQDEEDLITYGLKALIDVNKEQQKNQ